MASFPTPGTKIGILRNLRHLRPPVGGAMGGKFRNSGVPTHAQPKPAFVQPHDRVPYWNIVPGDTVTLRRGKKIEKEDKSWTKGEAQVVSIDRELNRVWLENKTNPELNPAKGIKHIAPRLMEPDKGAASALTPNTTVVAKPVHYSNLSLRIPEDTPLPEDSPLKKSDLKAGVYAKRLERTGVQWSRGGHHYVWDRIAIVRAPDGQTVRLKVPWPKKVPMEKRLMPSMADSSVVSLETWIPWAPTDPVHLPSRRARTSPHSDARHKLAMEHHAATAKDRPAQIQGYAQYIAKRVKAPPIAQAPTPAEEAWVKRREQEAWAKSPSVAAYIGAAGRSFAADDYLALAPTDGPYRAGWEGLPLTTPEGDGERDAQGVRHGAAGTDDVDAWPIELLMQRELAPDFTLAKRMRTWKVKQEQKKSEKVLLDKELRDNVKAFRKMTL